MPSRTRAILETVRELTKDPSFSSYGEINRAYREIGRLTHWNFLRRSSQNLLSFKASTSSYALDMSQMRRLTAIRFKKVTDQQEWKLMEEVTRSLLESRVRDNRRSDGTDDEKAPEVYHIEGSTLLVAPSPDQSYTVRVEWIANMEELDEEVEPQSPEDHDDMIAYLAASNALHRPGASESDVMMGDRFRAMAMGDFDNMLGDVHPNRTENIDRTPIAWLR